jgi:hypothetical protein
MNVQEKLSELSMKIADNIRAHNQLINEFDAIEKEVKELQQQPVTTNWYDFTDEQKEHLSDIVSNFIDNLISEHLRSTDVFLREGAIQVNVDIDLADLVNDALPYGINDGFQKYLEDEITEQREEQQQDC